MSFVDPTAASRYNSDNVAARETRAMLASWEYLAYQRDALAAENAKNALLAAIEAQHRSARALVEQVMPKPHGGLRRPLSPDERG